MTTDPKYDCTNESTELAAVLNADPEGAVKPERRLRCADCKAEVDCLIDGRCGDCHRYWMRPDYPNARDCKHGQLRRKCERCEDAARIAELESELSEKTRNLVIQLNRTDKLETALCERDARIAALESESAQYREAAEKAREGEAAAMALVLNHEGHIERLRRENAAVYHHYLGVGTTVLPGSLVMFRRWLSGDDPCTPAPTDAECAALAAGEG
jgi:hypothetical protein